MKETSTRNRDFLDLFANNFQKEGAHCQKGKSKPTIAFKIQDELKHSIPDEG